MSALSGHKEGRATVQRWYIHLGSCLQQNANHIQMPALGGKEECCGACRAAGIQLGALFEQLQNTMNVSPGSGQYKRRGTVLRMSKWKERL